MKQLLVASIIVLVSSFLAEVARSADVAEPLLGELPFGVIKKSSLEIPAGQLAAIGTKLGGKIDRVTNSVIQVHGRAIQVNVITAADEANAKAVHTALSKIKPYPFCLQKAKTVIEYVGKDLDHAIAIKTSYELGLLEKPATARYRVTAELGLIDKADYMSCNPLFNYFLALQSGKQEALPKITELSKKFQFGQSLILRNPKIGNEAAMHTFQPAANTSKDAGVANVVYSFGPLPDKHGVPYVTATIETTVDGNGLREIQAEPAKSLTSATKFWPTDDAKVKELAQKITNGKTTNGAKAMAILEWLTPGQNIQYSGQTGSRWGTAKVFEQKFGHCWDFSDCFVTLARAAGVPSRQVAGWLYGTSGHVWAEFYREGKGWQQVDPTGGGKLRCGIYHIPYFTSEDGEMPLLYISMPKVEALPNK